MKTYEQFGVYVDPFAWQLEEADALLDERGVALAVREALMPHIRGLERSVISILGTDHPDFMIPSIDGVAVLLAHPLRVPFELHLASRGRLRCRTTERVTMADWFGGIDTPAFLKFASYVVDVIGVIKVCKPKHVLRAVGEMGGDAIPRSVTLNW